MDEQGTNPQNKQEQSTEPRKLDHNGFFTNTFQMKRLAKRFLWFTLPSNLREHLDFDGLTIEQKHLVDNVFKSREADIIYRVPIKGSEHYVDFFIILEHKSFNDLWTIFQLWIYVALVCQRNYQEVEKAGKGHVPVDYRLPPVIAIIIHHGESRFSGKTELSELFSELPGIENYLPKLQAVLFDLSAISDDDVPDDPEVPELKLVLMALKIVFRKDAGTTITAILKEMESVSGDPLLRDVVCMVWYYFVTSAKHMDHDYNILYDTINKIVEVESMSTMLEKAEAKGQAKGKAEGKAEMVLKALRRKFKQVPQGIEDTILSMSDQIALESLLEHAIDSETLDEFVTAL
jgi:predicted transposase YdaD